MGGFYMKSLNVLSHKFFSNEIFSKEDYQCLSRSLSQFCKTGKKEDAFCVYYCFCEIFKVFGSGYDSMDGLLHLLSDHEYHSGELLSKHRDHYSHSVYVFALGLAIYANDINYKVTFQTFYRNEDDLFFLKVWGMTSLFHDIGYPFEIAHQQIKTYTENLWGKNSILSPFVSYEHVEELLKINEKGKALNSLLAIGIFKRLGYPIRTVKKVLKYRYKGNKNYMDHGYFSAILLARQILLTNSNDIDDDTIIDVLTAILLHNSLNKFDLSSAKPIEEFKHPLAYLLILCDELQCWDRTAFGYISKKDPLAWDIEMDIQNNSINICYIFNSFMIDNPVNDKKEKNNNVKKILDGEMICDIKKIIVPHSLISIQIKEEEKVKKTSIYASSNSLINLCAFAKAIHQSYQQLYDKNEVFEDLSLEFKLSNIEQAKTYSEKLELINCFYSNKELDYPIINSFSNSNYDENSKKKIDDLEFLAREEHVRWVKEKLDAGWKYGTNYKSKKERNEKKIHKDIVPFEYLEKKEKEKDILMINNMIPLLYEKGDKIRIYRFRYGRKPILEIAGIGHKKISTDKEVLKTQIKKILKNYDNDYRIIVRTCYAYGADQLIAECANELGITTKAVLPLPIEEYIKYIKIDAETIGYQFDENDELNLRHLLAQTVVCKTVTDDDNPYFAAKKYIIDNANKVIALWDGVELSLADGENNSIDQWSTYRAMMMALNEHSKMSEDIHIIKCEQ